MDLTLSKRGGYAARAAICLARAYETGKLKKLREISAEMEIPRTFVSQIVGDLVHAGIAVSSFGRDGGHRLSRPPGQITLAEVVEAAEGSLVSERCALGDGPCRWQSVCPLHETISTATASMRKILDETTLATLAERDVAITAGTYPVPADAHRHIPVASVADSVHVELPAALVGPRLTGGNAWLTRHAEACDEEEEARVRVGPGGPDWLGKTVAVHIGDPADDGGVLTLPIIWEATGPAGLFPRLEGELQLNPLDPDRCELALSGRYRPPLGRTGHALDDAFLTRLARATVRSFLKRLARVLEEQSDQQLDVPYG